MALKEDIAVHHGLMFQMLSIPVESPELCKLVKKGIKAGPVLQGHHTAQCQFDLLLHPLMATRPQLLPAMSWFSTSARYHGFVSSEGIAEKSLGTWFVWSLRRLIRRFRRPSEESAVIMAQIYSNSMSDIWELIKYLNRNSRPYPPPHALPKGIKH